MFPLAVLSNHSYILPHLTILHGFSCGPQFRKQPEGINSLIASTCLLIRRNFGKDINFVYWTGMLFLAMVDEIVRTQAWQVDSHEPRITIQEPHGWWLWTISRWYTSGGESTIFSAVKMSVGYIVLVVSLSLLASWLVNTTVNTFPSHELGSWPDVPPPQSCEPQK